MQDTLDLGIPLFDIDAPELVEFDDPSLTIDQAKLLVSPELATALNNESLTGANIGSARIDGLAESLSEEFIRIAGRNRFGRTTINGDLAVEFSAAAVDSVFVDLGRGSDLINVNRLDVAGDLLIDLGAGSFNYAVVNRSQVGGELEINGGSRFDGITINRSTLGSLDINSGGGTDSVTFNRTHITGDADIDLGVAGSTRWLFGTAKLKAVPH